MRTASTLALRMNIVSRAQPNHLRIENCTSVQRQTTWAMQRRHELEKKRGILIGAVSTTIACPLKRLTEIWSCSYSNYALLYLFERLEIQNQVEPSVTKTRGMILLTFLLFRRLRITTAVHLLPLEYKWIVWSRSMIDGSLPFLKCILYNSHRKTHFQHLEIFCFLWVVLQWSISINLFFLGLQLTFDYWRILAISLECVLYGADHR